MARPESAEGLVVCAAIDGDRAEVTRLLEEFYPHEIRELCDACRMVIDVSTSLIEVL